MKDKAESIFNLLGITIGEVFLKPAREIDHGFSVICLRCAGKGSAKISLEYADGLVALACSCGNLYAE